MTIPDRIWSIRELSGSTSAQIELLVLRSRLAIEALSL